MPDFWAYRGLKQHSHTPALNFLNFSSASDTLTSSATEITYTPEKNKGNSEFAVWSKSNSLPPLRPHQFWRSAT